MALGSNNAYKEPGVCWVNYEKLTYILITKVSLEIVQYGLNFTIDETNEVCLFAGSQQWLWMVPCGKSSVSCPTAS